MTAKRAAFAVLCFAPIVVDGLGVARPLRETAPYTLIGIVCFAVIAVSAWLLGLNRLLSDDGDGHGEAAAGGLFLLPVSLFALLLVGIGPPWEANPNENVMRYEVLAASSVAITVGFVFLHRVLVDSGERTFSVIMFSLSLLAGAAALTWHCFQVGYWLARVNLDSATPVLTEMNNVLGVQITAVALLTYIATAAAAVSMMKLGMLSRFAPFCYLAISAVAIALLILRGVTIPNPNALTSPWYETPSFIVSIPAIPWLMPIFLGIVLLKLAGTRNNHNSAAPDV